MGEIKRLKVLEKIGNLHIVIVRCVCHNLALSISSALKEIPLEFYKFVPSVFNYIQHSSKYITAHTVLSVP